MNMLISVALRKESVDRNNVRIAPIDSIIDVALRKESVDRNTDPINLSDIPPNVALRKESVDRNATFARSCARFSSRSP